jgi:TM2 domain-containing membrane protein YozV
MKKNLMLAFFLGIFPGLGHFYLGKKIDGFLYGFVFFGTLFMLFLVDLINPIHDGPIVILLLIAFLVYGIQYLHLIIRLIRYKDPVVTQDQHGQQQLEDNQVTNASDSDRFFTIILSFIPGLGHFQLGLMNRGLTFMLSFFGMITMTFFITIITGQGSFLVFLGALPIIWIYSFFDTFQQLNKKQRGEELVDKTILEDFESSRDDSKKSKMVATVLSIIPGAGHMYLGLQRRGLQLMAGFLFAIFILDTLRLSAFLFLIPIIWFYSFFDALQQVSKDGKEPLNDTPVISYFINHQKWVGIGLIVLGGFYLFDQVLLQAVASYLRSFYDVYIMEWYHQFFQTTLVSILLIVGGVKLLAGSKKKKEGEKA